MGNVSVGHPSHSAEHCTLELQSLLRHYDSVLFAYGASEDKKLGIPGESTLDGIYSARQFVAWYNGLPDYASLDPDLSRGEEAVIIGQGNVALDVARMLLEDIDVLRKTDITEHALAKLASSRIKRVHVVGRRGPMQVRDKLSIPEKIDRYTDSPNSPSLGSIHDQRSARAHEASQCRVPPNQAQPDTGRCQEFTTGYKETYGSVIEGNTGDSPAQRGQVVVIRQLSITKAFSRQRRCTILRG